MRFALLGALSAAGLVIAASLRADPASGGKLMTSARPAPAEHRVDFRADRVEIEPDAGALVLEGAVVVRVERFRLSSNAVTLSRSPRGVHVEGSGELALCPCSTAPLTFGFRRADLAPPTDVLLQNATVRLAGIPLFWSPYLWLRAPERLGALPPSIAYRGEEGLLLGTGLHLPLAQTPRRYAVDFGASAYIRGGLRLNLVVDAPSGRTAAEFDYFRGAALDVVSSHSVRSRQGAVLAARLDLLRGERAAVAPATIERGALPSDRLRVGLGRAGTSVVGFGFSGDAARAGSLEAFDALGPTLSLGTGGAIGRWSSFGLSLVSRSARAGLRDAFLARAQAGLSSAAPLGPALYEVGVRQRAEISTLTYARAYEVRSELRSRLGLPLARRFGAVSHSLEPFTEAALSVGSRNAPALVPLLSDAAAPAGSVLASAGLENALGSNDGRAAASLRVAGGAAGAPDAVRGVVAASTRVDVGSARLSGEVRGVPSDDAVEVSARAEVGARGRFRLAVHVDGAAADARSARGLFREDFVSPAVALLDRRGWSGGGSLAVPWGQNLVGEIGSDVDISERRWLASSAAVSYRHPCRCLSVTAFGSRRVGRRDVDLGLNIELVPR